MNFHWWLLILAGLFEAGWAIGLKYTDGFTRPWPTIGTVVAIAVSMILLAIAVRELPIGTAYAVWVGIGVLGTLLFGVIFLGERATFGRLFFAALLLIAIIGLKWTSPSSSS